MEGKQDQRIRCHYDQKRELGCYNYYFGRREKRERRSKKKQEENQEERKKKRDQVEEDEEEEARETLKERRKKKKEKKKARAKKRKEKNKESQVEQRKKGNSQNQIKMRDTCISAGEWCIFSRRDRDATQRILNKTEEVQEAEEKLSKNHSRVSHEKFATHIGTHLQVKDTLINHYGQSFFKKSNFDAYSRRWPTLFGQ